MHSFVQSSSRVCLKVCQFLKHSNSNFILMYLLMHVKSFFFFTCILPVQVVYIYALIDCSVRIFRVIHTIISLFISEKRKIYSIIETYLQKARKICTESFIFIRWVLISTIIILEHGNFSFSPNTKFCYTNVLIWKRIEVIFGIHIFGCCVLHVYIAQTEAHIKEKRDNHPASWD